MPSPLRPLVVALVVVAVSEAPAAAATGPVARESSRGQIIAVARNGHRTVVSSIIVLRGVFNGVGTIVEVPNRPTDPDNASHDNLVFTAGTLRIISFNKGQPRISLNPQTCLATVRIAQTTRVTGGRGRFRHARGRFQSLVRAHTMLARHADGSCDEQADAVLDGDALSGHGTMSL